EAGRAQPQSRNRAAALRRGAAGRAVFSFAAAVGPGKTARPDRIHEIGDHGRARRGTSGGIAGHGRSAHGRSRFSDNRPIPAADAEAPPDRQFHHPRGIRGLSPASLRQGLSDGIGLALDPFVVPRRRGFRPAQDGSRRRAREQQLVSTLIVSVQAPRSSSPGLSRGSTHWFSWMAGPSPAMTVGNAASPTG